MYICHYYYIYTIICDHLECSHCSQVVLQFIVRSEEMRHFMRTIWKQLRDIIQSQALWTRSRPQRILFVMCRRS